MADEQDVDLNDNNQEDINREISRNKSLSDKVKKTSEERDAEKARADEAEAKANQAQKDVEFFKNFNTASAKYPGSSEYQDKIREKANLGLDVEEATMLVMAKEGKYNPTQAPVERESAAGGSATTSMPLSDKSIENMSQSDIRAALVEAEAKGEFKL